MRLIAAHNLSQLPAFFFSAGLANSPGLCPTPCVYPHLLKSQHGPSHSSNMSVLQSCCHGSHLTPLYTGAMGSCGGLCLEVNTGGVPGPGEKEP